MKGEFIYGLNPGYVSQFWKPKPSVNLITRVKIKDPTKNLNKGFRHAGELSKNSRKRIINAAQWLNFVAKRKNFKTKNGKIIGFKLQMITLTLPSLQRHDDKVLMKKLINPILDNLRKNYNLKNYILVMETQANGNLHFHMLTDSGITYWVIRKIWNNRLVRMGYIEEFRKSNPGSQWPNSVDIIRIDNKSNIIAYIAKYISKKESKRRIPTCRLYTLSQSLSRFKEFRENSRSIASIGYHYAKLVKAPIVINDWATIAKIEIKRLCGLIDGMRSEIMAILKQYCKLEPALLKRNWMDQPNQLTMAI